MVTKETSSTASSVGGTQVPCGAAMWMAGEHSQGKVFSRAWLLGETKAKLGKHGLGMEGMREREARGSLEWKLGKVARLKVCEAEMV